MKKPTALNIEVAAYLADVRLQDTILPDYMQKFAAHFKIDLDQACELLRQWLRAVYGRRYLPHTHEDDHD